MFLFRLVNKEDNMAFYCRKPKARGERRGVLTTLPQRCARSNSESKLCGGWKYFLADCRKPNTMCSALSGAWVAASTVCGQRLF